MLYYFILTSSSNNNGTPNDILKVRWITDKNYRQFNGMKSEIKFIIDKRAYYKSYTN